MTFYKAVDAEGYSGLGRPSEFVGKLPHDDQPGDWVEIKGELKVDKNSLDGDHGIHLASRRWLVRYLCDELYEAESRGETYRDGRYIVGRRVRLLQRLPNWNATSARLFAADCAQRVLHFYEEAYPGDDRPRKAIEVARKFARGGALEEELAVAKASAFDAHEAAADHSAAKSASLAAAMCGDLDQSFGAMAREVAQTAVAAIRPRQQRKERRWQTNRLFKTFAQGQ